MARCRRAISSRYVQSFLHCCTILTARRQTSSLAARKPSKCKRLLIPSRYGPPRFAECSAQDGTFVIVAPHVYYIEFLTVVPFSYQPMQFNMWSIASDSNTKIIFFQGCCLNARIRTVRSSVDFSAAASSRDLPPSPLTSSERHLWHAALRSNPRSLIV